MRYRSLFVALLLAPTLLLAASCDDDLVDPTARFRVFTIVVEVATTGENLDANGYIVQVEPRGLVARLGPQERIRVPGLPKGREHTVTITDVAANCVVQEGVARRFDLDATDIRILARKALFQVVCG